MYGLTVRWSLAGAGQDPTGQDLTGEGPTGQDLAERLREYVAVTSLERFTGMPGLRFKTWRMRPGEWFEGLYVFATEQARNGFLDSFREQAPTAPGTRLIGSEPVLMEPCEVVAVAQGGAGFAAGPGPGAG